MYLESHTFLEWKTGLLCRWIALVLRSWYSVHIRFKISCFFLCASELIDIIWFLFLLFVMQPHGFFNCSPAVDVPPSTCDVEIKENGIAVKPIQNGLLAKL
jgi:hypothetical protein